jgi:hypothetical protein
VWVGGLHECSLSSEASWISFRVSAFSSIANKVFCLISLRFRPRKKKKSKQEEREKKGKASWYDEKNPPFILIKTSTTLFLAAPQ